MIKLNRVSAGYNQTEIIKDITIAFEKGSVTTIISKNGCGKTTLLKTAGNLLKPFRGDITVNGVNIAEIPGKELAKRLAYLPQNRPVPNISVYDLVIYGRYPYLGFSNKPGKEDKRIVKEAIESMNLSGRIHENLRELSGGGRQKVYLAMVLAQDTDIVFLDEPTTYLDINHQLEILEIVKKLKKMNKTVVMVLHDLDNALSYSDKICLMDRGRILIHDTPQAVFESGKIERVFDVYSEQVYIKNKDFNRYVFFPKTG